MTVESSGKVAAYKPFDLQSNIAYAKVSLHKIALKFLV